MLVGCLPLATATAAGQVDQQQPVINTQAQLVLGIGGASEERLAQVVSVGRSGDLVAIALAVACADNARLVVQIQGVAADAPDGVVRASYPFDGIGPTAIPPTLRTLTFADPVHFAAGDRFAFVLNSEPPTAKCSAYPGPIGNPYAGGDGFYDALPNAPGWIPLDTGSSDLFGVDLPFQTFVEAAPTAVPVLSTGAMILLGLLIAAARLRNARAQA